MEIQDEHAAQELAPDKVDLKALIQNSLSMVKEKALKHGIQLESDISGLPYAIVAEDRKLKQIIYNLLSNAVRFTPDNGKICVIGRQVSSATDDMTPEEGRGSQLLQQSSSGSPEIRDFAKITVEDTGIGLASGVLEQIFNPFDQVETSKNRRFQGTGLGLAITRQFVEMHGGRIWAHSEGEGKGSCFNFIIPRNIAT